MWHIFTHVVYLLSLSLYWRKGLSGRRGGAWSDSTRHSRGGPCVLAPLDWPTDRDTISRRPTALLTSRRRAAPLSVTLARTRPSHEPRAPSHEPRATSLQSQSPTDPRSSNWDHSNPDHPATESRPSPILWSLGLPVPISDQYTAADQRYAADQRSTADRQ